MEIRLLDLAHQVASQTRQHLAKTCFQLATASVAIADRLQNDVDIRFARSHCLRFVLLEFAEREFGTKSDLCVDAATPARRVERVELQGDLILVDADDFGVMVGDEATQFLDGQINRNRRDNVEFSVRGLVLRLEPALSQLRFALFLGRSTGFPVPSWMTRLRPLSFAFSNARSARESTVSGESPDWNSVTPKLAVIDSLFRLGSSVFSKSLSNRFGSFAGRRIVAVWREQQELFAAIPCDKVAIATVRAEYGRKADQCFVASRMSVNVVDSFEVIDVTDDQAKAGATRCGLGRSILRGIDQSELDWRHR